MKLVLLSALLISCLASSSVLSAPDSLLQSETQKLVNSLKESTNFSPEQKIKKYKALLQKENTKSDLNNLTILILNEAIVTEMGRVGNHVEVTTIFKKYNFLDDINKNNQNTHFYVDFLAAVANSYLNLQEYDNAKKVLEELHTYLYLSDISDITKARVFMLIGQLHVMTGEYKDGLAQFRLTMEVVEKSIIFSGLSKLERVSAALSGIGNTYFILGDYKNAIKYNERAIENANDLLGPNISWAINTT
jgi:tetratricopeptide (TPR) repeat protein